jgi:futalosine hydrolase
MHILLTAATKFEIEPMLDLLKNEPYTLNDHTIDVLITGVGQINTTYQLTIKLLRKKADLVIQAGIAGSFTKAVRPGQTVLIREDTFGDIGIEEKKKFFSLFDAGFAGKDDFPFTNGRLVNNTDYIFDQSLLKTVKAVTVNKVSDSLFQTEQLLQHFLPDVESMEGAAFHFVCLQQQVSFIQIRSVSNAVGERDKSKWVLKDAIINLNTELKKLICNLK